MIPQWHTKPIPFDAPRTEAGEVIRNEQGQYIDPPAQHYESSWWGLTMQGLHQSNRINEAAQRAMGYQVYDGDTGEPPERMNHYEQCKASSGCYQQ